MRLIALEELPPGMEKFVRGVPYILSVPPDPRYPPFWIPALKITTWHPTTCFCTINYSWDRRVPPETRKHRYISSQGAVELRPDLLYMKEGRLRHRKNKDFRWQEAHCPLHAGLRGEEWFSRLIDENSKEGVPEIKVLQTGRKRKATL